jgi:hypothetical protein
MKERLRELLERAGEYLDRGLGRGAGELKLASLVPAIQKAIEKSLAADEKGLRRIAPNKIVVRITDEIHSRLDAEGLTQLENTVREIALQHIRDHRYAQPGELLAKVTLDVVLTEPFAVDAELEVVVSAPTPSRRMLLRSVADASLVYAVGDLESKRRVTIGRAVDNDIVINDQSLSRFHAAISMTEAGAVLVADCGSANGTFVNGERIRTNGPLQPGDELRLGSVRLKVEMGDPRPMTQDSRPETSGEPSGSESSS